MGRGGWKGGEKGYTNPKYPIMKEVCERSEKKTKGEKVGKWGGKGSGHDFMEWEKVSCMACQRFFEGHRGG